MQNTFLQSGNDSKWFLKKIIFQKRYVALETPPPFMANTILNFHFDYWNTSLRETGKRKCFINKSCSEIKQQMQNWEFHAATRLCDLHGHTHHRHQEQFARNTQNSQGGDFLALCKSEAVAQESKPMFPPPASRASPESIWGAHLISSLRFLLTFFVLDISASFD